MVGAMIVLILVVAGFVAFRAVNRTELEREVEPVDYAAPARFAQEQADFELLTPRRLPAGWVATSVRFIPGEEQSWHIGLLTDEEEYVGLEQVDRSVADLVRQHVDEDAVAGDDVTIEGATWSSWTDDGGDTALTYAGEDVTTLVVGTVPEETLISFVESLR
jgi:hypothetical protein